MLFLHEVHKVVGTRTDEFEETFRKGLMPALARGDDARLLWYTNTQWAAAFPTTW
jgi:hypothetical protein